MKAACFILSLLVLVGITHAQQEAPDWETVLYVNQEIGIITLTQDGVATHIAVPDDVFAGNRSLSADHRWLAFERGSGWDNSGVVYVADLVEGSCCLTFDRDYRLPNASTDYTFAMIGISPQNAQLAMTYSKCLDPDCYSFENGVVLVDLASKHDVILHSFDTGLFGQIPVGWQEEGFVFTNGVYCMEGDMCVDPRVVSTRSVRDPETGETVVSTPVILVDYWLDQGDHLALTGEYISEFFYEPPEEVSGGLYAPAIVYYSPEFDSRAWRQNPTLIYLSDAWQAFPPGGRYYSLVHWAVDGNAVYVRTDPDFSLLLMRDGSQQMLDVPYYHDFLAGTPDGWLMYDSSWGGDPTPETTSIYHYRYNNGEISVSELARFERNDQALEPYVLDTTPMGATVTQSFAEVQANPPRTIG